MERMEVFGCQIWRIGENKVHGVLSFLLGSETSVWFLASLLLNHPQNKSRNWSEVAASVPSLPRYRFDSAEAKAQTPGH